MGEVVRFTDKQVDTAMRALRLQRAGKDMFDIARELDLSVGQVTGLIRSVMDEARTLVSMAEHRELLDMEVGRLNALQFAIWDDAMAGDVRAVEACMRLVMARSKLLGLEDGMSTGATTVVVTGDRRTYMDTLQSLAGGGNA